MNVRDGCDHLGTVGRKAARDSKLCPMEVFFNRETEPQKASLEGSELTHFVWGPR